MTWGEDRLVALSPGYRRIGRFHVPNYPMACPLRSCVYNGKDACDGHVTNPGVYPNPDLLGGNGDAACHRFPPRKTIAMLDKP